MTTITVKGGFHNSPPINLRIKKKMSIGQYKKLDKHMCGLKNCICGWRGFGLDGMPRDEFLDMLDSAAYEVQLNRIYR